jgi:hypothetical protein
MEANLAEIDVSKKAEIYHTLYLLNLSFASIVGYCRTLQQTGIFRPQFVRLFEGFTQELQAEINQEFLGSLESIEIDHWNRFAKIREKREKYLLGEDAKPKKRKSRKS